MSESMLEHLTSELMEKLQAIATLYEKELADVCKTAVDLTIHWYATKKDSGRFLIDSDGALSELVSDED